MKQNLHTPCYIIWEEKLKDNLRKLKQVSDETGCKILLAQKAFSNYKLYPLIGEYLQGTAGSGLFEAKLGFEEMGKENHVFSPAYKEDEIEEIIKYCDHIVLNSPSQCKKFVQKIKAAGRSVGLRINPEFSTQQGHEIYDPCAPFSRMGTTLEVLEKELSLEEIQMLDGFHFHTLCEQNSDDLERTLLVVEEKFGKYLHDMKWMNLGGGHHITREDYDSERLKRCISHLRLTYDLDVYLEPGEAIALNAGSLMTEVLEIMENGKKIAILDASAACHMPDVLEMPYQPPLKDAMFASRSVEAEQDGGQMDCCHEYRLAGATCLSGDVIGDYLFEKPLEVGQKLEFLDMAIYTMVKNNTFNGMKLPDIVLGKEDGSFEILNSFGYEDFKMRL